MMVHVNLLVVILVIATAITEGSSKQRHIINKSSQRIKSPNYPEKYRPNEDHEWIFNKSRGIWAMTFEKFIVEQSNQCLKDYVRIKKSKTGVPEKLCGEIRSHNVLSEGSYLQVEFHSDDRNEEKGFSINVQHFMDENDARERLKESTGTDAYIIEKVEHTTLFYGLMGVLALAVAIFVAMLGCLVVGLVKRKKENERRQQYITNIHSQMANVQSMGGRRYSRSKSASFSKEHTKPEFLRTSSNQSAQSTTALLSYNSAGYPQVAQHL